MGRDEIRAGDSDRQAVADQLKSALDEGRLDLGEYDERLQRTYAAKTFGDLSGLLDDLPGTVPPQHSQLQPAAAPATPAAPETPAGGGSPLPGWAIPYGGVFLVCTLIWLVTSLSAGKLMYYWPVWMLIPLIFGVMGQWRGGHGKGGHGKGRDRRRPR